MNTSVLHIAYSFSTSLFWNLLKNGLNSNLYRILKDVSWSIILMEVVRATGSWFISYHFQAFGALFIVA